MPEVHPTAIIDPTVELADDVRIGPGCVLQGRITLGPGVRLLGHVYLEGPLTVGRDNLFYPFACIGFSPQHRRFDPATPGAGTVIGDGNVFRESTTVHRAIADHPTRLGDRNFLMAGAHVGHDCVIGSDCTFANSAMLAGHVEMGDGVTLGGNAGIHQFCRVGRMAMISGNSGISQDIPPFCVSYELRTISSLNLIGLRRGGYRQSIDPLKKAFDLFFLGGLSNVTAVTRIDAELGYDPLCREFAAFIRGSKRGITRYAGRRRLGTPQAVE
jgi:UDP-N-acetylglucosamine acyltransferase